jgi:D-alanyl-lipoteichoic acid acyltransferase DltB (MBOAT superfamily)
MVRERHRWLVLLLSSYAFYGFILKPILLVALTAVIIVTYQIGWLIEQSEDRTVRRTFLWGGIIANVALLIYFKYLPFVIQNLTLLLGSFGIDIIIKKPLPLVSIGLSFYIFQAISYLSDVYFRSSKPERHFGYFALYMAFFPKLLQGPIERSAYLIPQLKKKYEFNYDNVRSGMLLFSWGLFKKVVLASHLGDYVNVVYGDIHAFSGLTLIIATYAYAFQIYMDFSGYTDMALGSALVFNINLTQNFNSPYLSTSVSEFWRCWHISFSRWILDYIFEPLQMSFRNMGKWGTILALMLTFLIAGIWHGVNSTFIVFGFIHGIYLSASFIYRPYQKRFHKALKIEKTMPLKVWQIFVTFNLICFTLIFFRSSNLADAGYVVSNMLSGVSGASSFFLSFGVFNLFSLIVSALIVTIVSFDINIFKERFRGRTFFRWTVYYTLLLTILFLGKFGESTFLYFKF